jgi:glutamyl-tRNA synthetase
LLAQIVELTVRDRLRGDVTGQVEDIVLRRNDGLAAYNLAVVVDDAAQGVDQVVRGDDLLTSAPRQAYLGSLLGLPAVTYAHVPLALNEAGRRLAKRDGAVTLADLADRGVDPPAVLALLSSSLALSGPGEQVTPGHLLPRFDPQELPREPWVVRPADLQPG